MEIVDPCHEFTQQRSFQGRPPVVITDKFVYIHMPKTGGTFVTEVLSRLHSQDVAGRYGPILIQEPKHGTCLDIPGEHRSKPILSCIRNPYDWYVSQYHFAWWKRTFLYHPEAYPTPAGAAIEAALPRFQQTHPHFPEISFEDFLELCHQGSLSFQYEPHLDAGLYTKSCVAFFFREPASVLRKLDQSYIASGNYRNDMFEVRFIRTDRLNTELQESLRVMNYEAGDISFISTLGKILPGGKGRSEDQPWEKYYTKETREFIRRQDWAVFEMFPEFELETNAPLT